MFPELPKEVSSFIQTITKNSNGANGVNLTYTPYGVCVYSSTEKEDKELNFAKIFRPKHIYVNLHKRTLTVWWANDDTRTTVTCSQMDEFSVENGFRAALAKKIFGSYEKYSKFVNRAIVNG
jgi:hypothetical protein